MTPADRTARQALLTETIRLRDQAIATNAPRLSILIRDVLRQERELQA